MSYLPQCLIELRYIRRSMDLPEKPRSLTDLVRSHFLTLLLGAYLCASVLPGFGVLLRTPFVAGAKVTCVHLMLGMLLFTLGLTTPLRAMAQVLREMKWIGVFFGVRYGLALGLAILSPLSSCGTPEWTGITAGLILLLAAPTAASSSGWSLELGSSKSTTVALILGTTLLGLFAGPLLLVSCSWVADQETAQALILFRDSFRARFVVPWVVLPMVLGMTLRSVRPASAIQLHGIGLQVTPFALLLLNYSNASLSLPKFAKEFSGSYFMCVLLTSIAVFLILAGASGVSGRALAANREHQMSAIIGTSMSNTGFILVIAALALPTRADMHLPIIAYTFIQHLGIARIARAGKSGDSSTSTARRLPDLHLHHR